MLLMLFAAPERIAAFVGEARAAAERCGLAAIEMLPTTDMGGVEPFGFVDGVSQPTFDWDQVRTPGTKADRTFTNRLALGEILLGYYNEYGFPRRDRRSSTPGEPNADLLVPAAGARGRARPRPQRLLSRLSPAGPGRARLLALDRGGSGARRRRPRERSPKPWSDGA